MPNIRQAKGTKYAYKPDVGVKTDFETILQRFAQTGTVRYDAFAKIWKDMKMHLYCSGRQNQREAREFMEDCFRIAIQFCVPPSSFQVRAGGIYLLYGLYHFQLVNPKVKIRVTPHYWETMMAFQEEAREQQHLDLDFIFQSLVIDRAFSFTATVAWNYPTPKETEDVTVISENLKESCGAVEEIFGTSGLDQLALIHDQYHKLKVVLNGDESTKPDTSLDIIHQDLINGIYKTLKVHRDRQSSIIQGVTYTKHRMGVEIDNEDRTEIIEEDNKTSLKKGLKKKAFKTFKGYKLIGSDSNSDTAMESHHVKKDKKIVINKFSRNIRGRSAHINLFHKDELDTNMPQNPDCMNINLDIPEEENIMYKLAEGSDSEKEAGKEKGKAPAQGKSRTKCKKSKTSNTKGETCSDEDEVRLQQKLEEEMKNEQDEIGKRTSKIEIDLSLRSDTDKSETESPMRKKRSFKTKNNESSQNNDKYECNDDEFEDNDIVPRKKPRIKKEIKTEYDLAPIEKKQNQRKSLKGRAKKKQTVPKDIKFDSGEVEPQKPTAQQKLHQKLAFRAKESRKNKK